MKNKENPKIEDVKSEDEYIKVSFSPDYNKFSVQGFDENFINLLKRRIYDVSAINPELKVYLNGKKIKITNFKDYSKLYFQDNFLYKKFDKFELAIGSSNEFNHLSFVNSICTSSGGTHLNSVVNQIIKLIHVQFEKLHFNLIKNHFTIFLNTQIENPSFDSQTKDHLNTRVHLEIPQDFLKLLQKNTDIIDNIKDSFNEKEKIIAEKKSTRIQKNLGIPKLDDAIWAGGPRSADCTLILTEGDSAKSLAVSGLSVLGREKFGIFPLKGKFLNVRDAPLSQIQNNEEFQNLKTIIGLHESLKYDSLHKDGKFLLRYGRVILMCDQDFDGSHIKGLIMNMFHHFWPNLIQKHDFLQEIITPIVKAWYKNKEYSFFTIEDFENWKKEIGDQKFTSKYYKGLGTSTSKEAIQYFSDLPKHLKSFKYKDKKDDDGIELAFSKKRVNDRKTWLNRITVPISLKNPFIYFQDFINNELILFSRYDNIRSIPNLIDGLKPGQRKVLFACFKRNLDKEIKVAQLSGYVSEVSAYHHGEQSLHSTIINMAQDFVGSNNIPLLIPNGTFGSRLMGGKDAASPRYIFTKLNDITRYIFIKEDDQILEYNYDDGDQIEPKYYVPIIPMVLINGSEGIATGWSTFIPTFKPEDVIMNLLNLLRGKQLFEMKIWAKGFTGKIEKEDNKYITYGNIFKKDKRIVINELPLRKWTDDYKKFLIDSEYKFNEYHTEKNVHFEIRDEIESDDLISLFKLESSVSLNNMTLFDSHGNIKQYKDPNEILKEFYDVRLTFYQKRKDRILQNIEEDLVSLKEKLRFLKMIVSGDLNISKQTKQQIIEKMQGLNFKNLDHLLNIPIWSMSADNVSKLEAQIKEKEKERQDLSVKDTKVLWIEDLHLLLKKLKDFKISEERFH